MRTLGARRKGRSGLAAAPSRGEEPGGTPYRPDFAGAPSLPRRSRASDSALRGSRLELSGDAFTEYMGHSLITVSFDLCGHLVPGNQVEALTYWTDTSTARQLRDSRTPFRAVSGGVGRRLRARAERPRDADVTRA